MPPVRVLVVDDAVAVRRLVSRVIDDDPELETAGVAANGNIALLKLDQLNPDVVVLDIEMPEMDGLTALVEIRKRRPKLPVIMFSTLTERGASSTLEALARGATDYVTKPSSSNIDSAIEMVKAELLTRIKAFAGPRPKPALSSVPPAARAILRPRPPLAPQIIAIGSSTGGPNALADVISALPGDLGIPIVITQHMPPVFTRLLARRLDSASPLTVAEAEEGAVLAPNHVWIAPGDYHMVVDGTFSKAVLRMNQEPPENSCRPSVDVMFRSVAAVYGGRTLGVVLTGMGQDGMIGARWLREAGGQVVIQDEASSVVWGMPGAVSRAGLADRTLPLDLIAGEIAARARTPRVLASGA